MSVYCCVFVLYNNTEIIKINNNNINRTQIRACISLGEFYVGVKISS